MMVMLALWLSSCQPAQTAVSPKAIPTAPDALPTSQPEIVPSQTEPAAQPVVSATPTVLPQSVACFVTGSALVVFLPDNHRILLRDASGVQVFNLDTLKEENFLAASAKLTPAIALSPDGEVLAWTLEDNTIQLLRVGDKNILGVLKGHTGMITKLKFSPSGDRLYSASHDTWVRVWDRDGKQVHAFQPTGADNLPSEILGLAISPDGKLLATLPVDGPVKLWSTSDYQLVRELGGTGGYATSDIVFSPDGQWIGADTATGLFLWRTADGTQQLGRNPGINTMAVDFSTDGRFLVYVDIEYNNAIVLAFPDGSQKLFKIEELSSPV